MKPRAADSRDARRIDLYDTTLRDGTQREGISLSCQDKLTIAKALDEFGVRYIELGWPSSNPKDAEVFARARDMEWQRAEIAAFGSTRRAMTAPEDDPGLKALVAAGTKVCTIFGKSSIVQATQVLRTTPEENLRMIEDSVRFLVASGRRVIFDAEHFFDGFQEDGDYAMEALRAAERGGADAVVLCDTNGGTLPFRVEAAVQRVVREIGVRVGIHAHDDAGCAVANSLAAARAGARQVQGTFNGYGERCGNADFCSIIPGLELKLGLPCLPEGALARLASLARLVAEVANLAPNEHAPYVGRSAFAHKGGVHVAAVRRLPRAYEHIDPALVGNETRFVLSELAGRGTVQAKAEAEGVALGEEAALAVLEGVKAREADGYSFEAADGSVALLVRREEPGYEPPFKLVEYKAIVGKRTSENGRDSVTFAEATIKIAARGQIIHTAAEGNGPVSALDAALRKALHSLYPAVARMRLEDYKVRVLDGRDGTGAAVRVLAYCGDGTRTWTTVGASPNILEASFLALADAIEYGLVLAGEEERAHARGAA